MEDLNEYHSDYLTERRTKGKLKGLLKSLSERKVNNLLTDNGRQREVGAIENSVLSDHVCFVKQGLPVSHAVTVLLHFLEPSCHDNLQNMHYNHKVGHS